MEDHGEGRSGCGWRTNAGGATCPGGGPGARGRGACRRPLGPGKTGVIDSGLMPSHQGPGPLDQGLWVEKDGGVHGSSGCCSGGDVTRRGSAVILH